MRTKAILAGLVLAIALLATACPNRTNIGAIQANPAKYYDKEVIITGRVTNSFGVPLLGGVYKLDDGTGSIWVLTTRDVPNKGVTLGVQGKIQNGLSFGGKSYGMGLYEDKRKFLK